MPSLIALIIGIVASMGSIGAYQHFNAPEEALGAFGDPFISLQLAANPQNGYILSTDGTENSWIVNSGGGGGGGSSLWAYTTATGVLSPIIASTSNHARITGSSFHATSTATSSVIALLDVTRLTNLTSNGFVKTGSANGTLSIDTTTYESGLTAGDGLTRTVNDFDCDTASGSVFGCLASADWTTFNNKADTSSAMTGTFDGNNFAGGAVATGDLLYGASAGSITELTIGTAGQILVVSGGLPAWVSTTTMPLGGDVTGTLSATVVGNDSHDHTSATISGIDISADTNLTAGDALTLTDDDIDFDGGTAPAGELGGTWASPTVDAEITTLEELFDVGTFTQATGDVIYWDGDSWENTATTTWDTNTTYTAGDALTLTGTDIDFDGGTAPAGALGGTWASPTVDNDGHSHTGTTLSAIDLSDDVNLTAGDALTLTGDDIDFDGGTAPSGELGGTWGAITIDDSVAVTSWNLTTPTLTTSGTFFGESIDDFTGFGLTLATGDLGLIVTGADDEECLTYEATGPTIEWATCGSGGGGALSTTTDNNPEVGEDISYITDDFYIGGSASNTAEFNFDVESASFTISSTSAAAAFLGLGTTSSPTSATLSIHAGAQQTPFFAIGSSTASLFTINAYGGITLSASQPATTTAITLDWNSAPQLVEYRIGGAATTITVINATTTANWGSRKVVTVCNPNGTAGALTWQGPRWIGTSPTQTTTANKCDVYSFIVTRATSSSAYTLAGTAGTGL